MTRRRDDNEILCQRREDTECVDSCETHAGILLWNRQEIEEDVDLVRAREGALGAEMLACLQHLVILELVRVRFCGSLPLMRKEDDWVVVDQLHEVVVLVDCLEEVGVARLFVRNHLAQPSEVIQGDEPARRLHRRHRMDRPADALPLVGVVGLPMIDRILHKLDAESHASKSRHGEDGGKHGDDDRLNVCA